MFSSFGNAGDLFLVLGVAPDLSILQDLRAFLIAGFLPVFDLFQSSKAAETNIVFIQTAITNARVLDCLV
jgi:hypothetical protein